MTQNDAEVPAERHQDLGRVEAFSDGVFAFAATLLVLGIRIPKFDDPDASAGLSHLLFAQWPSFAAFALSFATVGIVWANHHIMFGHFVRIDRVATGINLVLLMLVAFLPVPTAVLGGWLVSERDRFAAVIFYGGLLLVFGVLTNVLWWYAAYRGRLTTPDLTRRERRALTLTWLPGPIFYGVCVVLALIDPRLSVAGFVLIHIIYVLPLPRLVGVAQRAVGKRRARSGPPT